MITTELLDRELELEEGNFILVEDAIFPLSVKMICTITMLVYII